MLIEHLPPESATMTALRNENPTTVREDGPDPAEGRWSQLEVLIASLVDELRYLRHDYRVANGDKKAKKPDPIRRPGMENARHKSEMTPEQYDWLFRHINGIAQDDEFVSSDVAMKPATRPAQ